MEDMEAIGIANAKSAKRARLRIEKAQKKAIKAIKTRCFLLFISKAMVYAIIGLVFIAFGVYKQVAPWISVTGAIVCLVLLSIHIDREIWGRSYE